MQRLLAQGVLSVGQAERTPSRLKDRLYLLAALFPAVVLLGACSALAWADTDRPDSPPLDAGADAAASRKPAVRQQVVPAAFLLRDKVSVADDPHLPELVKARNVCSSLSGTYKVCVSSEGSVEAVDAVQSIPGADANIAATLRTWRFKLRAKPACALLNFDFDVPGAGDTCDKPRFQPTSRLREKKLGGDPPHWPAGKDIPAGIVSRRGIYKLCAGKDGTVTAVAPVVGLPGADGVVIEALKKWRFQPLAFPACTFESFLLAEDDFQNTSSIPVAQPASGPSAAGQGPGDVAQPRKLVPAMLIRKDKITTGDDPHLPDEVKVRNRGKAIVGSYKICIAQDGAISSVDAVSPIQGADENIVKTLYGWRYRPQPLPICFFQYLEFRIE